MDDRKRQTLVEIRLALDDLLAQKKVTVSEAGKQFVQLACDYLEADEYTRAHDAMTEADRLGYFQNGYWVEHRKQDREFRRQLDLVDDVFNVEYFRADGVGYA